MDCGATVPRKPTLVSFWRNLPHFPCAGVRRYWGSDCTAKVAAPSWYIRQNDGVKGDNPSWRMEREGGPLALGDAGGVLGAVGPISGGWLDMSHTSRCVFLSDREVFACRMIAQ